MKINLRNRLQKLAGLIKEQQYPENMYVSSVPDGYPNVQMNGPYPFDEFGNYLGQLLDDGTYENQNEWFDENIFVCPEGQENQTGLCQDPEAWFDYYNTSIFNLPGGGFPNALNIFLNDCCENESFSASCPEGQTLIQVGQIAGPEPPQPGNQGPVDQEYVDMCANPNSWYNVLYDMFDGNITSDMNLEGMYQNGCCKPETTGCGGFMNLDQDFQDVICTQCEDPDYNNMHCECCPEQEEQEEEEPPTPQAMPVTVDTPGAPDPKKYKKGGTDPKYLKDKEKFLKKQKKGKLNESVIKRFQKLAGIKPEKK